MQAGRCCANSAPIPRKRTTDVARVLRARRRVQERYMHNVGARDVQRGDADAGTGLFAELGLKRPAGRQMRALRAACVHPPGHGSERASAQNVDLSSYINVVYSRSQVRKHC